MPPNEPKPISVKTSQARFVVLVVSAIIISLLLTLASLALYKSSGTSQLDLSKPGYSNSYREKVAHTDNVTAFPSDGPVDKDTINKFDEQYDKLLKQVDGVDAFGGDVLSDKSLQIEP